MRIRQWLRQANADQGTTETAGTTDRHDTDRQMQTHRATNSTGRHSGEISTSRKAPRGRRTRAASAGNERGQRTRAANAGSERGQRARATNAGNVRSDDLQTLTAFQFVRHTTMRQITGVRSVCNCSVVMADRSESLVEAKVHFDEIYTPRHRHAFMRPYAHHTLPFC